MRYAILPHCTRMRCVAAHALTIGVKICLLLSGTFNKNNKDRCIAYLQSYARKDHIAVATMFADDIVLRDWKILVRGKAATLAETERNFKSADSFEITPLGLYEHGDTVAAELKIVVDGTITLNVVDVIRFNAQGQIQAIRAYLGVFGPR